jgi:RNA polymerase sigma-70 factor (ECF subfamily)
LDIRVALFLVSLCLRTFNIVYNVAVTCDLGDPQAFRRAFDDHHRAVYTAAFRIVGDATLAQDVVQDVFLRLWRRPGSFDPARGDLRTYLRLMGRSRALDLWRETQVRGRAADRLKLVTGHEEPRFEEHPAVLVERSEDDAEVRKALGKLPEAQREAIVLAYWGGLTADQIAQRARVPLGTAKSRIRLGLARLRDEFALVA